MGSFQLGKTLDFDIRFWFLLHRAESQKMTKVGVGVWEKMTDDNDRGRGATAGELCPNFFKRIENKEIFIIKMG